jgi:RES domain-containing protein
MRAYRIAKRKYVHDLSGAGAGLMGGRWNSPGHSVVYAASSKSLALLEMMVHLSPGIPVNDLVVAEIDIPDHLIVTTLDPAFLPANWDNYKIDDFTRSIGDNWLENKVAIGLKVPSIVVRNEFNILLNPLHPGFKEINIVSVSEIANDTSLVNREKEIVKTDPVIQKRLTEISRFAFDVFISHASEDNDIVVPVVREINKYGLRYWFDQEQIGLGDRITKGINEGMHRSRFVLAIISTSYANKAWTMAELNAALTKQISNQSTIILPVLVGNKQQQAEILDKVYLLRDSRYIEWDNNPERIVHLVVSQLSKE